MDRPNGQKQDYNYFINRYVKYVVTRSMYTIQTLQFEIQTLKQIT